MLFARETTLTFFVMYLSPLTSDFYLLVNFFEKPGLYPGILGKGTWTKLGKNY